MAEAVARGEQDLFKKKRGGESCVAPAARLAVATILGAQASEIPLVIEMLIVTVALTFPKGPLFLE